MSFPNQVSDLYKTSLVWPTMLDFGLEDGLYVEQKNRLTIAYIYCVTVKTPSGPSTRIGWMTKVQ